MSGNSGTAVNTHHYITASPEKFTARAICTYLAIRSAHAQGIRLEICIRLLFSVIAHDTEAFDCASHHLPVRVTYQREPAGEPLVGFLKRKLTTRTEVTGLHVTLRCPFAGKVRELLVFRPGLGWCGRLSEYGTCASECEQNGYR